MTTPAFDIDAFATRSLRRFRVAISVRFSDLDPNDHVNHARYLAFLEEARVGFRDKTAAEFPEITSFGWPVGEITVRYRRSIGYPARVEVELAPLAVGRTSLTLGYGIFHDDQAAAVAVTRSVCMDRTTGRSTPIPDALAVHLRGLV